MKEQAGDEAGQAAKGAIDEAQLHGCDGPITNHAQEGRADQGQEESEHPSESGGYITEVLAPARNALGPDGPHPAGDGYGGCQSEEAYDLPPEAAPKAQEEEDGGQREADGVDPTEMPAVAAPAPGGVSYQQMRTLIQGLVGKGRVAGMDVVEITPKRDINAITCVTAVRLFCNLIGKSVRAGHFD